MVRAFFSRPRLLLIPLLVLACLNSCTKQAIVPPSTNDIVKYYQRIKVRPSGLWFKTDFRVSPGDYVLILASGKVYGRKGLGRPPHSCLFMKSDNGGEPRIAVAQPDNWKFFRSTETGRLAFALRFPNRESIRRYTGISGGFQIDIFIFSMLNENRILQALDRIAKANPDDKEFRAQLNQIIGHQRTSNLLPAVLGNGAWEIEDTVAPRIGTNELKIKPDLKVEASKQQSHTVFQAGHKASVRSAVFSPNGKYIISGGNDKTLRLWEAHTGREIRVFKGHSEIVSCVAFSPDGGFVLSGSSDRTLRLWDITTGKEIKRFEGHEAPVSSVAYSPDGNYIISGSNDKTLRLWETSTGKEIKIFEGHEGPVTSVKFGPVGKYVLSGSWDGTVRLWDVAKGKRITVFQGHKSCVNAVAFSPDGEFALSGSDDNTLRLWKTIERKSIKIFEGHKYHVTCLAISPNGKYVLSGSFDNTLRLWDVASGREIRLFVGHRAPIRSVTFSPDGRYALSSSNDKSLRLWEVSTGRKIRAFEGHRKSIRSVDFSPDGKFVLTGSDDSSLRLWEITTGKEIRSFEGHEGSVNSLAYSPNGKYIISGSDDKTIRLWDSVTGRATRIYSGHKGIVNSVAFSPNGKYVASGSNDKTLRLWEVSTGREIMVLELHFHSAGSVAFSPDGRYVISRSHESFRMWEVLTGREVKFLGGLTEGLLGSVTSIAISPDSIHLLSGTAENEIILWKISPHTGARLAQYFLRGHTDPVQAVSFSPDGRYALSGSKDKTIRLWDISTGNTIRVFIGHADTVNSVVFSPDGKFVFSGGDDCSARLWNVESGEEIVSFHYSKDGEWMLTTPDGYYACSPEGTTLLYWVYPGGMETFTFEQFESRFKRPDIINARLAGNRSAGRPAPEMTLPPTIQMEDHLAVKETNSISYPLTLTTSASKIVKKVRVFVNGKPTLEVPVNAKEKEISLAVPLFSGANRITAVAYDEKGFSSNPKYMDLICRHAITAKPNLYIFAIGISNYPRLPSRWQLEFAHTDAQALINSLLNQEGKVFGEIRYNFLSNEKATVDNMIEALDALSGISANDVAIIFMAGHGVRAKDGTFYFLTSTGSFEEPEKAGVSWTLLGQYLARIKGRAILLLDACHSGSIVTETIVPNDELAQQFFRGGHGGIMVFSASKGRQFSMESPDIGGGFGIFTYALTQSLGPKAREADTNSDGFVEFMELVDYVSQYVHRETKGEQTPWLSRKELFGDLPVAMVN